MSYAHQFKTRDSSKTVLKFKDTQRGWMSKFSNAVVPPVKFENQ